MELIRGIEMELHPPGEALSDHIRREQDFFEAEILDYIRDNHNVQRTVLDIGANIGNHSIYFANFLDVSAVMAFEPLIENYEILQRNLQQYSYAGTANVALSNKLGVLQMSPNYGNMGASEINPEGPVKIVAIALDSIGLQDVTLMKIDVEWHEPEVLDGAQETIYRSHPLILIEDAKQEYAKLLPDYKLLKAWEHHKTYLYGWK